MMRDAGLFARLAGQHGLARAPLFRQSDAPYQGEHEVLLDGALGSFAVSLTSELDPVEASSWAWSSNVPHHVLIADSDVQVLRWDRPDEPNLFDKDRILREPSAFYEHLRGDRTRESRNIVQHSMMLFRTVRSIVHQSGLPDAQTMPAYLALLGALVRGREPYGSNSASLDKSFDLPLGASEVVSLLPQGAVENVFDQYRSLSLGNRSLIASPSLALRHASGAIFQEAHHVLVQSSPGDLFSYYPPAITRKPRRGAVHFTPPFLARALCEQVFAALGDLKTRKHLIVADIACGSAAFLVEALRALERLNYEGHVKLIGRDTSPIAIDMARFVLGSAGREWPGPGRFSLDLVVQDTLQELSCPKADVIVMNPPFTRYQEIGHSQRELSSLLVDRRIVSRPDISLAFVSRALDILAPHGALATLLPANALDADSMADWRNWIAERKNFYLTAIFDNQTLFSHAKVRVGAMVLTSQEVETRTELRAGNSPEDAGDALRTLRRRPTADAKNFPVRHLWIKQGRVTETEELSVGEKQVQLFGSRALTQRALHFVKSTVADLFDLRQGIRTGEKAAFVLREADLKQIPIREQAYFRPAITSNGIKSGRITQYNYVFYPYGKNSITSETYLNEHLPDYYARYLLPFKSKLADRRARENRWWELSERRSGLEKRRPAIVSKYWAGPGGFVPNDDDHNVVLQGFGWTFSGRLAPRLEKNPRRRDIVTTYLALLNSKAFFSLVAEHSRPTGGGQLDMSPRYLNDVPLVDLTEIDEEFETELRVLAEYGEAKYRLFVEVLPKGFEDAAELAARILLGIEDRPLRSTTSKLARPAMPDWVQPFIDSGREGTDRAYRVHTLVKMQELAQAGEYQEIDAALEHVPLQELAETSLMTLLRGTYRFRARLKYWTYFRDKIANELERRGAPVRKLLVGLYE